jgi:hypothetical protein
VAKLYDTGGQYPHEDHIERIARYKRNEEIFAGRAYNAFERASQVLKDGNPKQKEQLEKLYMAVNIMDVILTKPADLMVGEEPIYESGKPDDSLEQQALNRIVEDNELNKLIHETVVGAAIRGDAFLKVSYAHREDFSELPEGVEPPEDVKPEPIIEALDPKYVFPEVSRRSNKVFKAVNIAWVEWVDTGDEEIPFLNVERHLPGFIQYDRFRLHPNGVDTSYGTPVDVFKIGERVPTGRDADIVETGVPRLLVKHFPYKATDTDWQGISGIEKIDSILAAINDRLVQIDYILHKHSDPAMYGPDLENGDGTVRTGGMYITVTKDDVTPGYMTWDSKLDGAFKELDILIGLVFMMSETPQWLFGTTLSEDKGGTGTSHTDGVAIKARFMPILSKVKRIRMHVDKAVRDAIWDAMALENVANEGIDGFEHDEPVYPKIMWKDGIPANEKELAEIMQIRTGGRPTIDQMTAIKRLDEIDDMKAKEILDRIKQDDAADSPINPDDLVHPPSVEENPEDDGPTPPAGDN